MHPAFVLAEQSNRPHQLILIPQSDWLSWIASAPEQIVRACKAARVTGENIGAWTLLSQPGANRGVKACAIIADQPSQWDIAHLPYALPEGDYRLAFPTRLGRRGRQKRTGLMAFGWGIGCYRYDRYRDKPRPVAARLVLPTTLDHDGLFAELDAVSLVRDLVNTPANDLGPLELADQAANMAKRRGATCSVVSGEQLLADNWPAIYTVGRASARAPRLIDIGWRCPNIAPQVELPRLAIIGKGVCFDTGGLDLKPSSNMLWMKKDMGGAAHALALGEWIMRSGLRVDLRVLVPAVENAVSGDAMRPLDVIQTRKGITVEIGNTDAEGRLVLCDALAEASSWKPNLIIDFATLTGAARVALGPDIAAAFSDDAPLLRELMRCSEEVNDPVWSLPLYNAYRAELDSSIADLSSTGSLPYAGSILAALFLNEFRDAAIPWLHLDIMAWNPKSRRGRPEGGEANGLRAVFYLLEKRFGKETVV